MLFRKASIYFSLCFSFSLLDILIMVSSCHWYAIMTEWKSKYLARLLSCNYLTLLGSGSKRNYCIYCQPWHTLDYGEYHESTLWSELTNDSIQQLCIPQTSSRFESIYFCFWKTKVKLIPTFFLFCIFQLRLTFQKIWCTDTAGLVQFHNCFIYFCIKKIMKWPF